jgi:hypothetical protein
MVEAPYQWGYAELVGLFRRAGFVSDGPALPTEPITVYRGVCSQRYRSGISWTTSREQARWFAKRFAFKGRGVVYSGTVAPEHVLGMFNERGECEVVTEPLTAQAITAVERGLSF